MAERQSLAVPVAPTPTLDVDGITDGGLGGGPDSVAMASGGAGRLDSSMPSPKLEHDAQTLGLRDSALPLSAIGSPQQMQIRAFI